MTKANSYLYNLAKHVYTSALNCTEVLLDEVYDPAKEKHYFTHIMQGKRETSDDKIYVAKSEGFDFSTYKGCHISVGKNFCTDELVIYIGTAVARICIGEDNSLQQCDSYLDEGFELLTKLVESYKNWKENL